MTHITQHLIGSSFFKFEEVTSTNDILKDLIDRKLAQNGAVVTAKFQTHGKGQQSNLWESAHDENILMSIFVLPNFLKADEQVYINLFVSLAVFDLVNELFLGVTKIKWPNDIYVNNKKIAGILIENSLQGDEIKSTIIGIGLNVNQVLFANQQATSITQNTKKTVDVNEVLKWLIDKLNLRFDELSLHLKSKLMDDYHQALYRINTKACYLANGKEFEGEISGIDRAGRLMVKVNNEIKIFANKEIEYK